MINSNTSSKNVLYITYSFPPVNRISAKRSGKFAKYLPEFGWKPLVITSNPVGLKYNARNEEVKNTRVFSASSFIPISFMGQRLRGKEETSGYSKAETNKWRSMLLSCLKWFRPLYSLPVIERLFGDPIVWYYSARKQGLIIIKDNPIDIIFSSSNPPMAHKIASYLHTRTGVPWVAEYRDLWSLNAYKNRVQPFQYLEECLEKRTMKNCNLLISVSDYDADKLRILHSKITKVIPNGFDEEDYMSLVPLLSKFTITYTGSIYPQKRDPSALFKAIVELKNENKISANDIEVRFYGGNVISTLSSSIYENNIQDIVKTYGFVTYKESIRRQMESSALLLLSWNDDRDAGTSTGKIYEYLGARRPIIALALKSGAIDRILTESNCGIVVNEVDDIKNTLMKWLEEFHIHGDISSYYSVRDDIVKKYSRRDQARELTTVFNQVVSD